jgi:hypothetical protein
VLLDHGIAIANGCFYHDIFAATMVSAHSCLHIWLLDDSWWQSNVKQTVLQ